VDYGGWAEPFGALTVKCVGGEVGRIAALGVTYQLLSWIDFSGGEGVTAGLPPTDTCGCWWQCGTGGEQQRGAEMQGFTCKPVWVILGFRERLWQELCLMLHVFHINPLWNQSFTDSLSLHQSSGKLTSFPTPPPTTPVVPFSFSGSCCWLSWLIWMGFCCLPAELAWFWDVQLFLLCGSC